MNFGEFLNSIRKEKGDSLRSLGDKLGFNFNYISQIEKGTSAVGKNFLAKIVEAYPDKELELTSYYLKEVLPEKLYDKYINVINSDLKDEISKKTLIDFMLQDIDIETKKDIFNYMITKRENEYYKKGIYEKNKSMIELIKKKIEEL